MTTAFIVITVLVVLYFIGSASDPKKHQKSSYSNKKSKNLIVLPTTKSLVESIETIDDIKKLESKLKEYEKEFAESSYEDKKYERLCKVYENAIYKAYDVVFYYQFIPDYVELDTPMNILKMAYKVVEAKDFQEKRKETKSTKDEWDEYSANDIGDDSIDDLIEKEPIYLKDIIRIRGMIDKKLAYGQIKDEIDRVAIADITFFESFFVEDEDLSAGDQWIVDVLRDLGVPLPETLYSMGYDEPNKLLKIDFNELKNVNGFGPQRIEQLKKSVSKIRRLQSKNKD